jgi:hypothetical protein
MAKAKETPEYREIINKIYEGVDEFKEHVDSGTKTAMRRARVVTNELTKVMKEFRKISMDLDYE